METKRIFTSIDLPPGVKNYLQGLQNPQIRWIKWMSPDNFHITLNFLGDLDQSEIETAKQVLNDTIVFYKPFPIQIIQAQPERDMLWLILEVDENLYKLHRELLENFRAARIGKRERRSYAPHVLLGKSKTGRTMTWRPEEFVTQNFLVDRINLYESQLTPERATHILIQSFPMTPTAVV